MVDRPMASTFRAGRPRMRSRSAHLPTCILVASKAVRPRAKSVHKTQVKGKGKGTGKGKSDKKKPGKAAIVISSDSEDSEVDFPHFPPNQPADLPAEEPNQPLDVPWKDQENQRNQIIQILCQKTHPYQWQKLVKLVSF